MIDRSSVELLLPPPKLATDGAVTNQIIIISNSTKRVLYVSFGSQIRTNDLWVPPAEVLFKFPQHKLEVGEAVSFSDRPPPGLPWRYVVLQQKYYSDGWIGRLGEFIDQLGSPEKFGGRDHRGVADVFLFTKELEGTGEGN